MAPKAANSGIRQLSNGDAVIPSSTRADGSVRKEIRVKPGYRPPEDVELYKNRTAEAWKNRGKGGVPGAEPVEQPKQSSAANKNAKRREARKKAAAEGAETKEDGSLGETTEERKDAAVNGDSASQDPYPVDPQAEQAKEARKLAKKLRQARELKERQAGGTELLPEQAGKVEKIDELTKQLEELGFNAQGEKLECD
jgi:partner of Y14 and mago